MYEYAVYLVWELPLSVLRWGVESLAEICFFVYANILSSGAVWAVVGMYGRRRLSTPCQRLTSSAAMSPSGARTRFKLQSR